MRKGRWALLELGRERPDVIDSGTSDWDEKEYGADKGRKKPMMSFSQQVPVAFCVPHWGLVVAVQLQAPVCC